MSIRLWLSLKAGSRKVWISDRVWLMQLNDRFREYLEEAIGHENALVAFSAFEQPASVSVRVNPFKPGAEKEGVPVAWNRHGRMMDHRPVFTLDPLFHAGDPHLGRYILLCQRLLPHFSL